MVIDFRDRNTWPTKLIRPCRLFDAEGKEYTGKVYKVNLSTGECEEYIPPVMSPRAFKLIPPLTLRDANGTEWKG